MVLKEDQGHVSTYGPLPPIDSGKAMSSDIWIFEVLRKNRHISKLHGVILWF